MLEKKYYINNDKFHFEMNRIFKKKWLFACLTNEVKHHNDFITFDFNDNSILVHNFNGELTAFQNVCSHRLKRIHTEKSGNRPLFCMYHGWNYNKNGLPNIPKRNSFEINDIECLKLKKYKLQICGIFVFINMSDEDTLDLLSYLGDFHNELLSISNYLGDQNKQGTLSHYCNWKLLVENVLEGYHCPLVHKNSLVNLGYCIDYPKDIKYHNIHSSWHSPKAKDESSASKKTNFLNNLAFSHNSFYHIYIYPNLFISSTSGGFFYIGKMCPLKVDITDLNYFFYSPKYNCDLTEKEKTLDRTLFSLNCDSALDVILEDKPMVESCQSGLEEECSQSGILSITEEIRIIEFHNNLKKEYDRHA